MRGKLGSEFNIDNLEDKNIDELNRSYEKYLKLTDKYKNPIGANDLISVDPISNVAKINPKYQHSSNTWQAFYNRTENPQFARKKGGF